MNSITVDLDQIKEIALKGIRRATVFLGLGVNAARDKTFTQYELPENNIKFIPEKVSTEEVLSFKENFEKWIIWNCLRELIENFAIFLDAIHQSCLWIATNKGRITPKDANKLGPDFEQKGVEGKLKQLRTRFDIVTKNENYFATINQARNCITHRKGRIGPEDLKESDSFRATWRSFEIFVQTPNGKEISLKRPIPETGIYFKDGGMISLKFLERLKHFKLGEVIEFTPVDINEICFLVNETANEIVVSMVTYAKDLGIKVAEHVNQPDAE